MILVWLLQALLCGLLFRFGYCRLWLPWRHKPPQRVWSRDTLWFLAVYTVLVLLSDVVFLIFGVFK